MEKNMKYTFVPGITEQICCTPETKTKCKSTIHQFLKGPEERDFAPLSLTRLDAKPTTFPPGTCSFGSLQPDNSCFFQLFAAPPGLEFLFGEVLTLAGWPQRNVIWV